MREIDRVRARRDFCWIVAALLLVALRSAPAASPFAIGPGDAQDGWFVLPAGKLGWTLHHIPAEAPPGTVHRVGLIADRPALWATGDGRLVMAYDPRSVPTSTGAAAPPLRGWSLREVAANRRGDGVITYEAPLPLPPLEALFTPRSLVVCGMRVIVLGEASGEAHLRALDRGQWQEVAMPTGGSRSIADWRLHSLASEPMLLERQGERSLGWMAGMLSPPLPQSPAWSSRAVGAFDDVLVIGGVLHHVEQNAEGAWEVGLVRGERVLREAMLPPLDTRAAGNSTSEIWLVPVGDRLGWYWASTSPQDRPRPVTSQDEKNTDVPSPARQADAPLALRIFARVVSPSGEIEHDGPAILASPIARQEIEALGLALASLLVAVCAFVFRREGAGRDGVKLPSGTSLTPPGRRVLAALFDFALALAVSGWIWNVGMLEVVLAGVGQPGGGQGVRPFVTALVFLFFSGAIAEALTGRTLGKGMLGCRVISASTASGPTLVQAVGRNAVKAFCPPLAAIYLNPGLHTQVGLFGTVVVSNVPEPDDADGR